MGDGECVSERLCLERGGKLNCRVEEIARISEKRLDAHADQLDELVKSQVQNAEILNRLITLTEKVEQQMQQQMQRQEKAQPKKWYETKSGERIVTAGIIILVIVVCAAIGINALDVLQQITP